MDKKRLKLGLTLGGFVIFVYLLSDLFLLNHAAEKRYLLDKKATIENFKKNETRFNEIRFLVDSLPPFTLTLSKSDSVYLFFYLDNNRYSDDGEYGNSLDIILDTFSNQKNWMVKSDDSTFIKDIKIVEEHFGQFEKIYQLTKQIGCHRIANKEYGRLNIYFKTIKSEGFRYTSYYLDLTKNPLNVSFIPKIMNEHFMWNYYDYYSGYFRHPHWIVPNSEFK